MKYQNNENLLGLVLHAYQPPTQEAKILDRIVQNCYLPIAEALESNPSLKINLNINASLSELLIKYSHDKVIEKYVDLAKNDQIEFLESGAYHPILPLLSMKEASLQIELNKKINNQIFGSAWKPIGVWPPELAVSEDLLSLVESLGYKYIIVPEISLSSNSPYPTPLITRVPVHPSAPNLALFYRNREVSNNISFKNYFDIQSFWEHLYRLKKLQPEGIIIIGTDIETFGEHHQNYEKYLLEILKAVKSIKISQLLKLPRQPIVEFRNSSWSTSEEDLYRDIPYPLWAYPGNSIHEILNFHSDLISEATDFLLTKRDETEYEVKLALKSVAKAQYSCQTWWASSKDHFSKELIRKGYNSQKIALNNVLAAINQNNNDKSIVVGISNKLENRLNRYLSRIK